ncbi:MAG TPA: GTPase Era [Epulopiscium sp.]|nr:GTPase Era [Candidatus Epulonipiscium sp.]
MEKPFRSGFITLIGRTNVGKSTLMNRFVGEKIAITSNKPQTTRNRIQSVLTQDDFQAVFIDTPGIHKPKNKLGEYMVKTAKRTLGEVDVILFLIEPSDRVGTGDSQIIENLKHISTPTILVINKIDSISREEVGTLIDRYKDLHTFDEIIPISAFEGTNIERLMELIKERLPEGPQYFPDDMITDQPERQLVAELIREKALYMLDKEIPHGIAVEIDGMKKREDSDIIDIDATIVCERDSHKGIIIGKQGAKLKEIGTKARYDIERLLGSKVYLQLWVKVKKNWRDSDYLLKNFGYNAKNID